MLTHYAEGSIETGLLFTASCLFRINSVTLVIMLPAYAQYGHSLTAISYYRRLLADHSMEHSIHLTQFTGDSSKSDNLSRLNTKFVLKGSPSGPCTTSLADPELTVQKVCKDKETRTY